MYTKIFKNTHLTRVTLSNTIYMKNLSKLFSFQTKSLSSQLQNLLRCPNPEVCHMFLCKITQTSLHSALLVSLSHTQQQFLNVVSFDFYLSETKIQTSAVKVHVLQHKHSTIKSTKRRAQINTQAAVDVWTKLVRKEWYHTHYSAQEGPAQTLVSTDLHQRPLHFYP